MLRSFAVVTLLSLSGSALAEPPPDAGTPAPAAPAADPRFEYKVISLSERLGFVQGPGDLERFFNQMAREGWRLHGFYGQHAIFERLKR